MHHADRIRVATCIATILDIHRFLEDSDVHPEVYEQFRILENTISSVDLDLVDSDNLERIETATNRLFEELAFLFKNRRRGALTGGRAVH